jgi:hypothetical protein
MRGGYESIDLALPTLSSAVESEVRPGQEVLVVSTDGLVQQNISDGLIARLVDGGRVVRVAPSNAGYYGARRVAGPSWTGTALVVVDGVDHDRPDGHMVVRSIPKGWSQAQFDAAARRVKDWAVANAPIVLDPNSASAAMQVVRGWLPNADCTSAGEGILDGSLLRSLPAGALGKLYMDRRISSPALPPKLLRDVTNVLTYTPTEVWSVKVTAQEAWTRRIAPQPPGAHCP